VKLVADDHVPAFDDDWGEAAFSHEERIFAWNSFAVIAMEAGDPASSIGAILPHARARCELRFVVGTDVDDILPALRRHLDSLDFFGVVVQPNADAPPCRRPDLIRATLGFGLLWTLSRKRWGPRQHCGPILADRYPILVSPIP